MDSKNRQTANATMRATSLDSKGLAETASGLPDMEAEPLVPQEPSGLNFSPQLEGTAVPASTHGGPGCIAARLIACRTTISRSPASG